MPRFYLITSAQNSTPVHKTFWTNLEAYARHLNADVLVGRFVYNTGTGPHVTDASIRKGADPEYAPEIQRLMFEGDSRPRKLAKGLWWCPEMNILPTANRPLSGLETYGGGDSIIVPHAKIALESLVTGQNERTNFAYTTGACTTPNYISKKAGLKAKFHHAQAALVVEVDGDRWWVRQINSDSSGSFYDLTNRVAGGVVSGPHPIEAISWGDIHAAELDPLTAESQWGRGGMLDFLAPRVQMFHDLFSFSAASHHDRGRFYSRWKKWKNGVTVQADIDLTARFLSLAVREWCETVVVNSNHDRHADRWLDEVDFRDDLPNSEVYLEAQLAKLRVGCGWAFLPWAMRRARAPVVKYLGISESYTVGGVELGFHGDQGPNGARGTTQNLTRLQRKITKGHDHTATIRDGVYSAGVSGGAQGYATSPSSWSLSHVIQYAHRKRAIITCYDGVPWAP